jgi:hypothetical protein
MPHMVIHNLSYLGKGGKSTMGWKPLWTKLARPYLKELKYKWPGKKFTRPIQQKSLGVMVYTIHASCGTKCKLVQK